MVNNGEFLPGVPSSSCSFHDEEKNDCKLSLMEKKFGVSDNLAKEGFGVRLNELCFD